jgi:hypothetical protein
VVNLLNLIFTRFAWIRLNGALKLRGESHREPAMIRELPLVEPAALNPQPASVTEGTTELFSPAKREPVLAERDKRDTYSIN